MKIKNLRAVGSFLVAVFFGLLFFFLLPQAALSQDFSSLDRDLELLEDLIKDTLANTTEQQKLLEDLRESLSESGNLIANYESIITGQENLLRELQTQLNEMSETYRMQSSLSARSGERLKFWRNTTIIGIPAAALLSGIVVWAGGTQR